MQQVRDTLGNVMHKTSRLFLLLSLLLAGLAVPVVAAPALVPAGTTLYSPQAQATEPIFALQGVLGKAARQNFDTFMVTSDGRAYALMGETPAVEAEIVALRDQGPTLQVKVWGTLYPQGRVSATPEIVVSSIVAVEESTTPEQPLPSTQPQATVRNASINVRSGPSTDYTALNVLQQGQRCTMVGRNNEYTWWQVECSGGVQGWIFGELLDITGDTSTLPVIAVAPPPPPPTPAPPAVFYGWKSSYWRNRELSGEPARVADVAEVNWDWGYGPAEQPDNFSTRFERSINFNPGTYRFSARADDGVRVFIDNQPIIDQWHTSSGNVEYTADRAMYGNQTVRVEHYEESGLASLHFNFTQLGGSTIDGGGSGEWEAQYYNNPDLAGNPLLVRREPRSPYPLDSDWGYGSPAPGIIPDDNWSARWRGRYFFEAGSFMFQGRSDDGLRVYIDGIRVIDAWYDGYKEPANQFLSIGRGDHEITIEFFERGGSAFNRVWWYRIDSGSNGGGSSGGRGRDE